jgi:tRNA (guanine-N(7)-)-methyltransferase
MVIYGIITDVAKNNQLLVIWEIFKSVRGECPRSGRIESTNPKRFLFRSWFDTFFATAKNTHHERDYLFSKPSINPLRDPVRVRTNPNPFSFQERFTQQAWETIFPHYQGTLDVEIGFGDGNFLERYAQQNPNRSLVGFEISKKLFDFAQHTVRTNKRDNVFLCYGNGGIGLADMFADNSIDRIFIFHPDPWAKRQHQKRRLVNEALLATIYQKLKPTGVLYLSSDVPALWHYMVATIEATQHFTPYPDETFWQTMYDTYWHQVSAMHQRSSWRAAFRACK